MYIPTETNCKACKRKLRMTTEGVWKMTEDGQFELQKPYATHLSEAKQ